MADTDDRPMPLKRAATLFGHNYHTLRKAAQQGRLLTERDGHEYQVRPSELERWRRANGKAPFPVAAHVRRDHDPLGRVLAVAIVKGGTGKTTTTLNLGAALAEQGWRVLLIDTDHQCSLTGALGVDPSSLPPERTLYGAMQRFIQTRQAGLDDVILRSTAGIDLVPASIRLSRMDRELQLTARREYVLRQLIEPLRARYDVILLDTMPTNSQLVINALVAADEVLIPLEPEKLAINSLALTLEEIEQIRLTELNPALRVRGVVLTQIDPRVVLHRDLSVAVREEFGHEVPILDTMIRNSIRFPESQSRQQTILEYEPGGTGASNYRALAVEVSRDWN